MKCDKNNGRNAKTMKGTVSPNPALLKNKADRKTAKTETLHLAIAANPNNSPETKYHLNPNPKHRVPQMTKGKKTCSKLKDSAENAGATPRKEYKIPEIKAAWAFPEKTKTVAKIPKHARIWQIIMKTRIL
jgi:hypothetical protein